MQGQLRVLLKRNRVKMGLCINRFLKRQDSNKTLTIKYLTYAMYLKSDCLETEIELSHARILDLTHTSLAAHQGGSVIPFFPELW